MDFLPFFSHTEADKKVELAEVKSSELQEKKEEKPLKDRKPFLRQNGFGGTNLGPNNPPFLSPANAQAIFNEYADTKRMTLSKEMAYQLCADISAVANMPAVQPGDLEKKYKQLDTVAGAVGHLTLKEFIQYMGCGLTWEEYNQYVASTLQGDANV